MQEILLTSLEYVPTDILDDMHFFKNRSNNHESCDQNIPSREHTKPLILTENITDLVHGLKIFYCKITFKIILSTTPFRKF